MSIHEALELNGQILFDGRPGRRLASDEKPVDMSSSLGLLQVNYLGEGPHENCALHLANPTSFGRFMIGCPFVSKYTLFGF